MPLTVEFIPLVYTPVALLEPIVIFDILAMTSPEPSPYIPSPLLPTFIFSIPVPWEIKFPVIILLANIPILLFPIEIFPILLYEPLFK